MFLVTFMGLFVASKRQPFVIEMNSFSLSATGEICPFPLSAEAQRALLDPYCTLLLLPLSTTTPSDECWFLIISPVVICHVDRPAARCMCAVGDLNGNGGSAGPRGGRDTRLAASADSCNQQERCLLVKGFFFLLWDWAAAITHVSACQSLDRGVITEQCLWIFILTHERGCHKHCNLGLGRRAATWFVIENESAITIENINHLAIMCW